MAAFAAAESLAYFSKIEEPGNLNGQTPRPSVKPKRASDPVDATAVPAALLPPASVRRTRIPSFPELEAHVDGPKTIRPIALEQTHDVPIPAVLPSEMLLETTRQLEQQRRAAGRPALGGSAEVTLHIYAWHNANPGALCWIFPDVEHAVRAVRVLRNAIGWAVVQGNQPNLTHARLRDEVLLEQS
jgi:hypothetical protein